jgi:hypothetical protein
MEKSSYQDQPVARATAQRSGGQEAGLLQLWVLPLPTTTRGGRIGV